MAISLRAQNGEARYGINDYILDDIKDLEQLKLYSCASGSTAIILSTPPQCYMKNNQGEWVKL